MSKNQNSKFSRAKLPGKAVAACTSPLPAVNTAQKQQQPARYDSPADQRQTLQKRGIDLPGPSPAPAVRDGTIYINGNPEASPADTTAKLALSPPMLNLITALNFSGHSALTVGKDGKREQLDVGACADVMIAKVNALAKGDTSQIEHYLISQAVALDAIFNEMARRASLNMGTYIEPTETYLRLGLKAQSQCRATLETLAEIKNPRPVYINPGQVNHANGPQQVNNGAASRASENNNSTNKILEN